MAADQLVNESPVSRAGFAWPSVGINMGKRGPHFFHGAGLLLFPQQPQGFAHDLAGVAELARRHLAGYEFFPSLW
jgi:hypothetical protein